MRSLGPSAVSVVCTHVLLRPQWGKYSEESTFATTGKSLSETAPPAAAAGTSSWQPASGARARGSIPVAPPSSVADVAARAAGTNATSLSDDAGPSTSGHRHGQGTGEDSSGSGRGAAAGAAAAAGAVGKKENKKGKGGKGGGRAEEEAEGAGKVDSKSREQVGGHHKLDVACVLHSVWG